MMILKLEKMGCDFYLDEQRAASDCTNFRLRVHDIRTRDGLTVSGDFLRGVRYDFSKATPRKTSDWQLYTDLSYTGADGMTWAYHPDGKGGRLRNYDKCTDSPYYGADYTLGSILRVVNDMSVDKYDAVELVQVHP